MILNRNIQTQYAQVKDAQEELNGKLHTLLQSIKSFSVTCSDDDELKQENSKLQKKIRELTNQNEYLRRTVNDQNDELMKLMHLRQTLQGSLPISLLGDNRHNNIPIENEYSDLVQNKIHILLVQLENQVPNITENEFCHAQELIYRALTIDLRNVILKNANTENIDAARQYVQKHKTWLATNIMTKLQNDLKTRCGMSVKFDSNDTIPVIEEAMNVALDVAQAEPKLHYIVFLKGASFDASEAKSLDVKKNKVVRTLIPGLKNINHFDNTHIVKEKALVQTI